MADKPSRKTPAAPRAGSDAGQLAKDDRGNVTWEWKDEGDLLADDALGETARLRALVDPNLRVKDDDDPLDPTQRNPKALKSGYNPYNSGELGKRERKKSKNLKELSKWIALRKKMTETKDRE